MKLDANGDLHIPAEIGGKAGLKPGVEVDIIVENGALRIVPHGSRDLEEARMRAALKALEPLPPPLRNADEIMRLTRGED